MDKICDNNRRILYFGNFAIEDINAAGKRVLNNARLIKKAGYSVFLLGVDKSDANLEIISPFLLEENIYIVKLPNKISISRQRFIEYYTLIKQVINTYNFETVISYGAASLSVANSMIQRYCKKNQIPIIVDVVDWLKADSGSYLFRFIKQLDIEYRLRIVNCHYDGIITISNGLNKYYRKNYKEKVSIVLPPLVEKNDFDFDVDKKIVNIVYAGIPFSPGRIIKSNSLMKDRFDLIIRLLAKAKDIVPSFILHVYGFTREQLEYSVPSLVEELNRLKDNVIFYGKRPMLEVQKALETADYTILIRDKNKLTDSGFPTKVVESISYDVPVITNRTSDIDQYLPEGHGAFYINVVDYKSAINKVVELLERDYNERLNQRMIIKSVESFNLSYYVEITSSFLKAVRNR